MRGGSRLIGRCALLLGLAMVACVAHADTARLRGHLDALTRHESRMVGSPGHDAAAAYIRAVFSALGEVSEVTTTVLIPRVHSAMLTLPDESLRIYPLWPNLVRLPATGPKGVGGRLVHGAGGAATDLSGQDVAGALVLLDWDSGDRWRTAARLGAAAIMFIEPEVMNREQAQAKISRAPHAVPRFILPRAQGLRLVEQLGAGRLEGRIRCHMTWQEAQAPLLMARIPGADPALAHEALLLQSHYDAVSVVPELAPGAQGACGMAALLTLAQQLHAAPPRRTVVVLAASAHYLAMEGMTQFMAEGTYQGRRNRSLQWPQLGLAFDRWIMLSLDLTSRSDVVGLQAANRDAFLNSGVMFSRTQILAPAARGMNDAVAYACARAGLDDQRHFFNGVLPPRGRRLDERQPAGAAFGAELAAIRGDLGFGLTTLDDPRPRMDTPHDRPEELDPDALARQLVVCDALVRHLANADALPPNIDPWPRDEMTLLQGRVLTHGPVGFMADMPVADALVMAIRHSAHTMGTMRTDRIVRGDETARYAFPGAESRQQGAPPPMLRLEGFHCDPRTGAITMATDLGAGGHGSIPISFVPRLPRDEREVIVFACEPVEVFDVDPAKDVLQAPPARVSVLDAGTDSEPRSFGLFWQARNVPNPWRIRQRVTESSLVAFLPRGAPFKLVTHDILGNPLLLLAGTVEGQGTQARQAHALGRGHHPYPGMVVGDAAYQSALDMHRLARARLDTFERHGIRNDHLSEVLRRGRGLLDQTEQAVQANEHERAGMLSHQAWALLAKSYPVVKNTADDMVLAVMFYLALLLPFTVFAERLLFGFADIRKRLTTMAGLFLLVFIVLRYVHPAFDITVTPALILLAFVILVLSGGVTAIVLAKFQTQARQMREELGEVHAADIGRLSAGMVAFSLGVSNLRNRPLRTALTAATIILLTFCVLSFTSVHSYLGFRKYVHPGQAAYNGFLLADPAGNALPAQRYQHLRAMFTEQPDVIVAPRVWRWGHGEATYAGEGYLDVHGHTGDVFPVVALLQVTPQERDVTGLDRTLIAGRWFRESDRDAVIVPSNLAQQLELGDPSVEDVTVAFRAGTYRVIGVFDEAAYRRIHDLDGMPLAPLDRVASRGAIGAIQSSVSQGRRLTVEDLSRLRRLEPDRFMLLSWEGEDRAALPSTLGAFHPLAQLAGVAVAFPNSERAEAAVRELVTGTSHTVFSGLDGARYEYSAAGATSLQGLSGLWAPIGITVLIVLNTMMGAVYERRREIGIFSSLGLAPSHIGFLFLAEACVFANLAIVLGYLLGQGASKTIAFFALMPDLTLNYSAMSAVFTSVVVMAVVLASSAYPAWLGARMAAPSVERSWRLPEPEGDRFLIDLPFTVSHSEAAGLFRYLHEYFDAHVEYVTGAFYAEDLSLRLDRQPSLRCRVWLAPYDLGVSQQVVLQSVPAAIGGFLEFGLTLQRTEGDTRSWARVNRVFLGELRKQLLVWRALPPGQRKRYLEPEGRNGR